jgi:hypothetical protein
LFRVDVSVSVSVGVGVGSGVGSGDAGFGPPVTSLAGVGIGPTLPGFLSYAFGKAAFAGNFNLRCPGGVPPPLAAPLFLFS